MNLVLTQRLRIAGILIAFGLLIEAGTLLWNSPIGMLVFLGVGGLFVACGVIIYLLTLILVPADQPEYPVLAREKSVALSS